VRDRAPVRGLRSRDDLLRLLHLVSGWCHTANDVRYLLGMDAPHPEKSELVACFVGVFECLSGISNVNRDVMVRDLIVAQRRERDLCFYFQEKGMRKLFGASHS